MASRSNNPNGTMPHKIMRDALAIELHTEELDPLVAGQKIKRLRLVARALVAKAIDGDVQAIKEINERMDGKVPQAVAGADGEGPIRIVAEWVKPT